MKTREEHVTRLSIDHPDQDKKVSDSVNFSQGGITSNLAKIQEQI